MRLRCVLLLLILCIVAECVLSKKDAKKKKSIHDLTEHDVERIYREWEENDEDSDGEDLDDLDPRKPPSGPSIDIEALQSGKIDPQKLMEQSKKGKPLMIFVSVKDPPDEQYTEKVSRLWAVSLQNAHIPVDRYVVATDRVLLMTKDGSQAWAVKDYLITQTTCTTVNFEHLSFPCKGTEKGADGYQHPHQEL